MKTVKLVARVCLDLSTTWINFEVKMRTEKILSVKNNLSFPNLLCGNY